jgi:hypothetical protein
MPHFETNEFCLTPKAVIVHAPTDLNVLTHFANLPIQEK